MVVDDPFYYRLKRDFHEKISNRTIEEWGSHLTTLIVARSKLIIPERCLNYILCMNT